MPYPHPSYRLGTGIVVATVLASLVLCLATVRGIPTATRAAADLGDSGFPLGPFHLVERSGRAVTDADLADRVWVASFIFTRCGLSCPKISSVMKGLQEKFERTGVRLVSVSVDPEHDTPEVLAAYARRFSADPDRWWFLTGGKADVFALIHDRFKLPVSATSAADQAAGAEAVLHSERLALVDHGKVIGYFDASDPKMLRALINKARAHAAGGVPAWVHRLPAVNAALNASCAALLVLGWVLVRMGRARAHATTMIAAVTVSALFLACYLVYHAQVGSVSFQGVGGVRVVYFSILLSHTLLATFGVVPLVAVTLTRALRRQFDRHAQIAGITFPIWLYVSVTGVLIYLMLYHHIA